MRADVLFAPCPRASTLNIRICRRNKMDSTNNFHQDILDPPFPPTKSFSRVGGSNKKHSFNKVIHLNRQFT